MHFTIHREDDADPFKIVFLQKNEQNKQIKM